MNKNNYETNKLFFAFLIYNDDTLRLYTLFMNLMQEQRE